MDVRHFASLAGRWTKILFGRSYYHVPQPIGRHFRKGEIRGYYNDMTRKAHWTGTTDDDGVPAQRTGGPRPLYFPITIAQMALGVHDLWLEDERAEQRETFIRLADWLVQNQDERGGWFNPWTYVGERSLSDYSAMAQGQSISVLVRAGKMSGDAAYVDAAMRAFELMTSPVKHGGCAVYEGGAVFLEEYPELPRNSVLNGWVFSVFGVYDLSLATGDTNVNSVLSASIETIAANLDAYDAGYWSFYDLRGHIASPFYHTLHSNLLDALFTVTDTNKFRDVASRWRSYQRSGLNKGRAVTRKIWQKLKEPVNEPTG